MLLIALISRFADIISLSRHAAKKKKKKKKKKTPMMPPMMRREVARAYGGAHHAVSAMFAAAALRYRQRGMPQTSDALRCRRYANRHAVRHVHFA
jgi:hypothetical protein